MKEPGQPVIGAVERAADQGGDMGRAQEPVPRKLPYDFHVVVGEAEGRRLRRTAEPRPAGRCDKRLHVHVVIITAGPAPRRSVGMRWGNRQCVQGGQCCFRRARPMVAFTGAGLPVSGT